MALSSVRRSEWIQASIIEVHEDWSLVNRFKTLFNQTVQAEGFSLACQRAFEWAVKACQDGQWVVLQNAGKDLTQFAFCWKTSLMNYAISEKKDEWVKQLIEHRIDILSKDFEGNTPLHAAAKRGACHWIEPLCRFLSIDAENDRKMTPLFVAIKAGQTDFVAALMQKGAHITRLIPVDEEGRWKLDALGYAVMRGEIGCIDELMKSPKWDLNFSYQNIGGLLHVAIYFHQMDALKHLLKHYKKQLNVESRNQDSLTPLCFAASLDEQEGLKVLKEHDASIDAQDREGRLPIHYAALGYHQETIELLVALGSKVEPADHNRKRPIDLIENMPEDAAQSCVNLLRNLSKSQTAQKSSQVPHVPRPNNLALRGGGAKGLAFVGALAALYEAGILQTIERVAGTSAGAITAALVAINFPIDQLEAILKDLDLVDLLLDHPLSQSKLHSAYAGVTKDVESVLKTLSTVLETCSSPSKLLMTSLPGSL